jgi:hypothetical protein
VVNHHEALAKTQKEEWSAQKARDQALREQLNAHHSEVLAALNAIVMGASTSCGNCGQATFKPAQRLSKCKPLHPWGAETPKKLAPSHVLHQKAAH